MGRLVLYLELHYSTLVTICKYTLVTKCKKAFCTLVTICTKERGKMAEFNQAKYIQEYQKEKYDRCVFDVPKGQKKVICEHYKKKGYESMRAYIKELIRRDMNEEKENNSTIHIEKVKNEQGGTINIG